MGLAYQLVLLVQLVGFAALLGGCLAQVRYNAPEVTVPMLWGAWLQVATIVALAALLLIGSQPLAYAPWAVRLVLALGVLLLVAKNRKFADIPRGLLALIGLATFADAAIAVLWV